MKYALFAALLVTGTAHAERFSALNGTKLVEICSARDATDCTSYIEGISDTASFYQKLRPADGSKGGKLPAYVCVPEGVTGVQLREQVVGWAKQHPDLLGRQASGVVLRALDGLYKCK